MSYVCEEDGCGKSAAIEWTKGDASDPYSIETYATFRCLAHPPLDLDMEMRVLEKNASEENDPQQL